MVPNSSSETVVPVSESRQITIPEELLDCFAIKTPGRVVFSEVDGKLTVEPLPSVVDMQGIHAGQYEKGEVLQHLREMREQEKTNG